MALAALCEAFPCGVLSSVLNTREVPSQGVCFLPAFGKEGQMFHALQGNGAYRDQTRLQVSKVNTLEESQVFYSSLSWFMASGVKEAFLDITMRSQRQSRLWRLLWLHAGRSRLRRDDG